MMKLLIQSSAAALIVCLFLHAPSVAGQGQQSAPDDADGQAPARVAVFCQTGLSMELNAVAMKTAIGIADVFMRLGRFYPVSWNTIEEAVGEAENPQDFGAIARDVGADIYCILYLERTGDAYLALLKTVPVSDRYRGLDKQVSVRTRLIQNIPPKIAREVAWLHADLPISAAFVRRSGGEALIDAGEWHGLKPGRHSTDHGAIEVIKTARYSSLVKTGGIPEAEKNIVIKTYPPWRDAVDELEQTIDRNTIFASSVTVEELKGDDPGKRFAKAFCLVNNGASIILPGYGSYLACGYMGVKQKISIANAVLTPALVFTQLTLTEMMSGFKTNFAPWIRDRDKTAALQNLQIFCWSTLLTTYAASFLDQLSYQYEQARKLPPFFEHRDQAAAFLSLLVPGGGMFYKGMRIAGWSFYFAEMALAGFGAYSTGIDGNYRYAFGALALVKVVDILCAYLLDASYPVYRMERERQAGRMSFSMNILPDQHGKNVYVVSCNVLF